MYAGRDVDLARQNGAVPDDVAFQIACFAALDGDPSVALPTPFQRVQPRGFKTQGLAELSRIIVIHFEQPGYESRGFEMQLQIPSRLRRRTGSEIDRRLSGRYQA